MAQKLEKLRLEEMCGVLPVGFNLLLYLGHTDRPTDLKTPMRKQTTEDALETLKKYDTLILVDDSSSMREKDHRVEPPISRWEEVSVAYPLLLTLHSLY